MATKHLKSHVSKVFTCPLCLRNSDLPTVLQCMHYICRECISQQVGKHPDLVTCPFCETKEPTRHSLQKEHSLDAEKVPCGPCESEHPKQVRPASFQCIDCFENLCAECNAAHAKLKISKHHKAVKLDVNDSSSHRKTNCEDCKIDNRTEVGFFCKDHESRCCGSCAIRIHHKCTVDDIEQVVERIKGEGLIDDLRLALEVSKNKIDTFVTASKENITKLEDQVGAIRKSIRDIRKNLVKLLDDFENDIIVKSNHIIEKEKAKDNEQIKTCLRFTTAVEQSRGIFDEAIDKASNMDFYEVFKKVGNHSVKYASFTSKTLEDKSFTELKFSINNKVRDILAHEDIGTLVEKREKAQITPIRKKSIKRTKIVRAITNTDGKIPRYSSAAYPPNGTICLVDCNNRRCGLFDSSFQMMDVVSFQSCPWTTAYVGSNELAVTLPLENKIQFYKVLENKLQVSRCISTTLPIWGIAPADENNIAITTDCKGKAPGVGIISSSGDEIFSLKAEESEINFGSPWQFDFDVKRSRFLISSQSRDSVICISTTGKVIFEYKNEKLRNPAGISHDGDGNFYVCGLKSHNIHQVTPNGDMMRIIALPNLKTPFGICFCKTSEKFLVTTVENREEIQLFSLT